eukprot:scaffold95948_cov58-Phaeocystis_antarctica.AAC.4
MVAVMMSLPTSGDTSCVSPPACRLHACAGVAADRAGKGRLRLGQLAAGRAEVGSHCCRLLCRSPRKVRVRVRVRG